MSQMNSLWQLYLLYGLIVSMWALPFDVISLSTIARWFVKRRGFAGGLAKAGSGLGMMLIPVLGSYLISTQGWRTTYLIVSIIVVIGVLPLSLFLKKDPSIIGLTPYGMEQDKSSDSVKGGHSFSTLIHAKQFWMLCITMLTIQFAVNSVLVHITPHAVDLGASLSKGAQLISILGAVSIVGRVSFPTIGDRIGLRKALIANIILALVMLVWLYFANEYWQLIVFVLIYGLSHGGFFSLMSPLLAEMFGTKYLGSLFGILTFCGTIGGAAGPSVLGLIFDSTGSYERAFLLLIGSLIVSFSLVMFIKPVRVELSSKS
jgi:MFS family permease